FDFRPCLVLVVQPGLAKQFTQAQIARAIPGQQQHALWFVTVMLVFQPDIGAGNGLDSLALGGTIELHEAEQIAKVGKRKRRLSVFDRFAHQGRDLGNAVDNREFGVHAQMNKSGGSGFVIHVRIVLRPAGMFSSVTFIAARRPRPFAVASPTPAQGYEAPAQTGQPATLRASSGIPPTGCRSLLSAPAR